MKQFERIDPVVLLSIINTKLRNEYSSLDKLCEDLDINKEKLIETLEKIDYHYNCTRNQFI